LYSSRLTTIAIKKKAIREKKLFFLNFFTALCGNEKKNKPTQTNNNAITPHLTGPSYVIAIIIFKELSDLL